MFALRRKLHPYAKDDIRYIATLDELIARCQALTPEQFRRLYADQFNGQHGELVDIDRPVALGDVGKAMKQSYRRQGPAIVFNSVTICSRRSRVL